MKTLSQTGYFNKWKIQNDHWVCIKSKLEEDKIDYPREDMFQAGYQINSNKYTLDLGWYGEDGELNDNGMFICYVIKNNDWDQPVFVFKHRDYMVITEIAQQLAVLFSRIALE